MIDKKFYDTWYSMHSRCYRSSYTAYNRYGGRGIIVCPEWHSYHNFKDDMYSTWFKGATLNK